MEWYYVWWPWLTSKHVAWVCQHQLSLFLFVCELLLLLVQFLFSGLVFLEITPGWGRSGKGLPKNVWGLLVELKDDNDWVKRCITWKVEGIRQRGRPKKTWWDCVKNDMESLGLSRKDTQSRNKWRRRIKGDNWLTQVYLEKWLLKWRVCVVAWQAMHPLVLGSSRVKDALDDTIPPQLLQPRPSWCPFSWDLSWRHLSSSVAVDLASSWNPQVPIWELVALIWPVKILHQPFPKVLLSETFMAPGLMWSDNWKNRPK